MPMSARKISFSSPERSAISLSSFVGESTDPTLPPPRQENRLGSKATIPDGYAVVVGGLEVETEGESVSEVPLLGRLPLLGFLFRQSARSHTRARFFVFLRASVFRGPQFEGLRHLTKEDSFDAGLALGWPEPKPRVIR